MREAVLVLADDAEAGLPFNLGPRKEQIIKGERNISSFPSPGLSEHGSCHRMRKAYATPS